jgi:uncharacterized repeat protein (TIGR03803 family)
MPKLRRWFAGAPEQVVKLAGKSKLNRAEFFCAALLFCIATATGSQAQILTTLVNFDFADGAYPAAILSQAIDGNFYGMTAGGGKTGGDHGTFFKMTPNGVLTSLYTFCPGGTACSYGSSPGGGLTQAANGDFYGTTSSGGSNDFAGTVFEITPAGALTKLYTFDFADGEYPEDTLVQATNGNFYGTTSEGGPNYCGTPCGTIFSITPSGTLTMLHSFDSTDGYYPWGGLVQAINGDFYGTTVYGGANNGCAGGCGTVFKMTPQGALSTLYSFCSQANCADGEYPYAGLVQGTDGNFYGTTYAGANGGGTVFKISEGGTLTTLYSFCSQVNCADGETPYDGLLQGTDGNFYGATSQGAIDNGGTVFKVTSGGVLTTLYSFCSQPNCADGNRPIGGLIQATSGLFYGTTFAGGTAGDGTVFSLSVGLRPFVKTSPTSGKAGSAVTILGDNLTGATSVTFNGTAATFTVVSSSSIKATVPAGATTGFVSVTKPNGTLKSNRKFQVIQ